MCTVTWWRSETGDYGVLFNRDELRTRVQSIPVAAGVTANGTRFLAPHDATAGGTWLLANERGFIAGIVNHYTAAESRPVGRRSRGGIPLALAACGTTAEAGADLKQLECRDFAPFILLVWDAKGEAGWTWDGAKLTPMKRPAPPLTTSSHRTEEVCTWRRKRYDDLVNRSVPVAPLVVGQRKPAVREPRLVEKLATYQGDTAHSDGAFNVRMRRPDARTESLCRIEITANDVRFWHQREAADRVAALDTREAALPRR